MQALHGVLMLCVGTLLAPRPSADRSAALGVLRANQIPPPGPAAASGPALRSLVTPKQRGTPAAGLGSLLRMPVLRHGGKGAPRP